MNDLIKLDVFFFITTIAVLALSIAVIIVLVYLIKIMRDVRYISQKIRIESDEIIKDVDTLRTEVKTKGTIFINTISLLSKFWSKKKNKINNK